MAPAGKRLLRELRKAGVAAESPVDVGEMEVLVLIVLSVKPGRDPQKLAKGLGLSTRGVRDAWERLRARGLIAPRDETADPLPVCEATASGRRIAMDAVAAAELAAFEPDLLRSLRADELEAPFRRTDRVGGV